MQEFQQQADKKEGVNYSICVLVSTSSSAQKQR